MERTEGDNQQDQREDKAAEKDTINSTDDEQLGTDTNTKLSKKKSVACEKDAQGRKYEWRQKMYTQRL